MHIALVQLYPTADLLQAKNMDNAETQLLVDADSQGDSIPDTHLDSEEWNPELHPDNQQGLPEYQDWELDEKYQEPVANHNGEFIELPEGEYEDFLEISAEEYESFSTPVLSAPDNAQPEAEATVPQPEKAEGIAVLESDEEKMVKSGVHKDILNASHFQVLRLFYN